MRRLFLVITLLWMPFAQAGWHELNDAFESRGLELVSESPYRRIGSILFFLSDPRALKMEASFINEAGAGITYYIVIAPEIERERLLQLIKPDILPKVNIQFMEYRSKFSPWVQDFFLRFSDRQNHPYLLPTYSNDLLDNDTKPFELGIADEIRKAFSIFGDLMPTDYNAFVSDTPFFRLARVDRASGKLNPNDEYYKSFFPIRWFRYFYGEGGNRVLSDRFLFIDRIELDNMADYLKKIDPLTNKNQVVPNLESVLKRKIIPIGNQLPAHRYYVYHTDFYITAVDSPEKKSIVFLGHPQAAQDLLSRDEQLRIARDYIWEEKVNEANLIEAELLQQGFDVKRLPILFVEQKGIVQELTFNNAILSLDVQGRPAVYLARYNLPQFASILSRMETKVEEVYGANGLNVHFIEGGEQFFGSGSGQLRCSTGVLSYIMPSLFN